ncbi:cytochrome P450 CYP82D47-like isoform X2 [Cucurbita moschata]|uniref:Cytochrome P450 CYP82D47-like isoform X2 n=1 Tax=Cucurbita moschata TaxID=3662 RepID=A0A6J1FIL1_CUCMO|nr:cytochrome P450 CYP82D47-like isoform X2 [Cucurbita moschata]
MELPHISSTTIALPAIFALLFFLYALFTIFSAHRKRLPPQPRGAWPVIGHLPLLSGKEPHHTALGKLADVYGPIFMLRLGAHRTLIVSGWEVARECLTVNDKAFASRPKFAAAQLLGYDYAMFALSPYGSHWSHLRKIATLELLANHRLEKLQHIPRSEVQISIEKLHQFCKSNNGGNKALMEMETWFGEMALNTIFRMVVGKRFTTAFEGSGGAEYRHALEDFFNLFTAFVPSDLFAFLKWFDFGGHKKAMKKTAKVLDKMLDKWLAEHRERRNSGEVTPEEQDFMHVMLSFIDNEEFPGYDADTVIKSTCLALILGGFHTTTTEMTWALSLLLNREEAYEKVQEELDEHVGRDRVVKESDLKILIYLQAVVKETLRMYPAAQLSVPHESTEDCTIAGYHIPAKTRLWVNLYKLQRDPSVWENPDQFCPERFLTTQKNFDVKGQNPQLIPFGAGRRICPAMIFALQVLHLSFARLLHEFEIRRPSEEPLDMEETAALNITKKVPLRVILTPRLSYEVCEFSSRV